MEKINFHELIWALKEAGHRNYEISKATGLSRHKIGKMAAKHRYKTEYNDGAALIELARAELEADEIERLIGAEMAS